MEVTEMRVISDETAGTRTRLTTAIFWLIVAIAVCLKLLLDIVRQSFFLDGLIYASIARNLAEGVGTVWAPQFSKTLFPIFAEHPPLMMWLQSLLFSSFGDTKAVDNFFSLAMCAISLAILVATWRRLNGADLGMRRSTPVAVIFTIIAGRFSWGFANGILENVLIVFSSLAILFVVVAYEQQQPWRRLGFVIGAGLLTALALMSKGPVGLFPFAAPVIYWVSFRRPTLVVAIIDTIAIGAVIVGVFAVLWSMEGPRGTIERYVSVQLLTSLSGERGHNGAGLAALRTFVRVNSYPLLLSGLVLVLGRKVARPLGDARLRRDRWQRIVFFSLTGFSASLPLLLGPRVSSFYFNPSLPYFSAALAIVCAPTLWRILGVLPTQLLRSSCLVLVGILGLSLVLIVFNLGQTGQDIRTITQAKRIASQVCVSQVSCDAIVSTCGSVHEDWLLHAYLQRYFHIALADPATTPGKNLLASIDCAKDLAAYREAGIDVAPYRLLRRE